MVENQNGKNYVDNSLLNKLYYVGNLLSESWQNMPVRTVIVKLSRNYH